MVFIMVQVEYWTLPLSLLFHICLKKQTTFSTKIVQSCSNFDDDNGEIDDADVEIDEDNGEIDNDDGEIDDADGEIDNDNGEIDEDNGEIDDADGEIDDDNGEIDNDNGEIDDDNGEIDDDNGKNDDDNGDFGDDNGEIDDDNGEIDDDSGDFDDDDGDFDDDGAKKWNRQPYCEYMHDSKSSLPWTYERMTDLLLKLHFFGCLLHFNWKPFNCSDNGLHSGIPYFILFSFWFLTYMYLKQSL